MTRGGTKSGKKLHEPNAAATGAQTKRRSNLLAIGLLSGGRMEGRGYGDLEANRQMELKRTIEQKKHWTLWLGTCGRGHSLNLPGLKVMV